MNDKKRSNEQDDRRNKDRRHAGSEHQGGHDSNRNRENTGATGQPKQTPGNQNRERDPSNQRDNRQ